jgi:phosphoesterase RecJ-like protein
LGADGAVASVGITRAMVEESGAADVDTSEFTTPLLAVDGVRIAILFREMADGRVKVSLRSKGELDVQRIAAEFGGGGHRNASGIVMPGRFREVEVAVTAAAVALAGSGR